MSEQTPSQAEGERDDEDMPRRGAPDEERTMPPRTTPSQAEGERDDEPDGEGKS
ncbi:MULTISPECIES: hypothetical protein [Streptomyces]|uniref:Uncharacterized protein n=1 Tax=Streptomyces lycii TaxID=2654337 RepID=A0ABQ7FLL0_9ACTN|nr:MULTISPECIES: hypothetical protein [Streptomyces]KAF4409841.1 hypothetical protein GCU69_06975 [Streptomyces lycii]